MGKRKVNSSSKGKRGENYVVELLKAWWGDDRFSRNWIGASGAVGTIIANNENVPDYLKEALTGDIITPPDFPFSVESKFYETIDLYEIIRNDNATVRQFWQQAKKDAERINKIPVVIMRETRKQAYIVYRLIDFKPFVGADGMFSFNVLMFNDSGETIAIASWSDWSEYFSKERINGQTK